MHPYYQQIYVQAPTNSSNGIGIAGFVCGLIAFLISLLPGTGLIFVWFPALAGLILSIIGITKRPRGLAIAGLIFSILAPIFSIGILQLGLLATLFGGLR